MSDRDKLFASCYASIRRRGVEIIDLSQLVPDIGTNRVLGIRTSHFPSGSHFDLFYTTLIERAEKGRLIIPSVTPLIEASTGNAGAAFAWAARELGYQATVITHADTPSARVEKLQRLGATIIFSEAGQYAEGYVKKLREILDTDRKAKGGKIGQNPQRIFCVTKIQLSNLEFPLVWWLLEDVQQKVSDVKYFICAVGAGTTISSVGSIIKQLFAGIHVVGVEAAEAKTLTSLKRGEIVDVKQYHAIKRPPIGMSAAGLDPKYLHIDWRVIDGIADASYEEWRPLQLALFKSGLPVGRTTAAQLIAIKKVIVEDRVNESTFLTLVQDGPSSYDQDEYSEDGENRSFKS